MKNILLAVLTVLSTFAFSETKLPAIFGNNMVLQQQSKINIWGWDNPETSISIKTSWKEKIKVITSKNGEWKASIPTPSAGGPYEITVKGTTEITYSNILIGEVWLCSGQSNMEMPLKGFNNQPISGGHKTISNSTNKNIRLFKVNRSLSLNPEENLLGEWQECTPENTSKFSAVAYYFAKKLEKNINIPVGLIGTYWGGSKVEAWTNAKTLKKIMPEIKQLNTLPDVTNWKSGQEPSLLFNAMVNPLIPYTIKGTIWYQGESNRNNPEVYKNSFPAMVKSWREEWRQGDFPFYFVQIAPFRYDGPDSIASALLRESQLLASEKIENSGMVSSMDAGDCYCIHPANKKPIGERLASYALKNDYGFNYIQAEGPRLKEMKITNNKAILIFKNAPMGLVSMNKMLEGFEIAGANRIFYPAKAKVVRALSTLEISSPEVSQPVAVRYAFKNCSEGTLFNTEGVPAPSFRTDNW